MSRFFRGSSDSETATGSSSDDSSAYSSSDDSEQEQQQQRPAAAAAAGGYASKTSGATRSAFSRFLREEDDSSDSDDGKRVVRSAKDKFFDEIQSTIRAMENAKKINDWLTIQNEFDKLVKQISKGHTQLRDHGGSPSFYIKACVELEEFLNESLEDKDAKKKMNAPNAKALTAMKQKIRKHNKSMEAEIAKWRANPAFDAKSAAAAVTAAASDSEESETESEEESAAVKKAPAAKPKHAFFKSTAANKDSSEDESDEEDSEEDSDEETESDEDRPAAGVSRWKKAAPSSAAPKKKPQQRVVVEKVKKAAEEEDEQAKTPEKPKQRKELEITTETLYARLKEVLDARGRKGTDRLEQLQTLEKILAVAVTPVQKAKVYMALISARFDYNPGMSAYQSIDLWKQTEKEIKELLAVVEQNPDITITASVEDDDVVDAVPEDGKEAEVDSDAKKALRGSLVSYVSRLDDEFSKSLQNTDPHGMEYVERLKDEVSLYAMILRVEKYYESRAEKDMESIAMLKMLRLEHIYHKYNTATILMEENSRRVYSLLPAPPKDADHLVRSLCVHLYQNAPDRIRTRAVLCHVYHHALNKRYYRARDLLLTSHLQESIHRADVSTQILFNRAMAQIGICAFRCGLIKESHQALNDIMASLKSKDILAQGTQLSKYQQNPDMEKKERIRMLPFHMHINLELLECIQLTVSMLLEIPLMAMDSFESKKRVQSKHFRRLFEFSERQVFGGPPETYRDHILQGAKALSTGDWQACRDLLTGMKVWNLLPDGAEVKEILVSRVKEEALRTYMFAYGRYYDNLEMTLLGEQFELGRAKVNAILSKMIMSEELHASVDQPTGMLFLFHGAEPTVLQQLALHYCEKASTLVESNERLFESKFQTLEQQQQQQEQLGGRDNKTGGSGGGGRYQQQHHQQQKFQQRRTGGGSGKQ